MDVATLVVVVVTGSVVVTVVVVTLVLVVVVAGRVVVTVVVVVVVTPVEVEADVAVVVVDVVAVEENIKILLLPLSATQMFPEESKVTPPGKYMVLEVVIVAPALVVKFDWPNTSEALMALLNGEENFKVLLLHPSTIQRFPEESKAIPSGLHNPF